MILFFNLFWAVLGLHCHAGFFSLVAASRAYSLVRVQGLLIAVASRLWGTGSGRAGFGSCRTWAQ